MLGDDDSVRVCVFVFVLPFFAGAVVGFSFETSALGKVEIENLFCIFSNVLWMNEHEMAQLLPDFLASGLTFCFVSTFNTFGAAGVNSRKTLNVVDIVV